MITNRTNGVVLRRMLGLALLLVAVLPTLVHATRLPSANRECAMCHVMWITDFKRTDVTTMIPYEPRPVEKSGTQDVSSTDRMCFSCHDGFVLDSRYMWAGGRHGHPVGMKPSKDIHIPMSEGKQVFPLNDDGKMYCGTCHSAHGVDWGQEDAPIFMRVSVTAPGASVCQVCHDGKTTGPKHGNHTIAKPPPDYPAALFRAGSKFSKDGSVTCQSCHRPHGARGQPLLVLNNEDSSLCKTCHADKRGLSGTKHDMTVMAPESKNALGRSAAKSGPCSACHMPHDAKGPALWARATVTSEEDPAAAVCVGCHKEGGLAQEELVEHFSHPTAVEISKVGISVTKDGWRSKHPVAGAGHRKSRSKKKRDKDEQLKPLPLFDSKGNHTSKTGRISCPTCHDPHNWTPLPDAPPPGDPREEEGSGENSFLRIAQQENSELCVNCHVDKRAVIASKHNRAMFTKEESAEEAPQLEVGVCGACHRAHNALDTYMWARNKGPGYGGIEARCTGCHRADGMAQKKLTGEHSHPVGVDLLKVARDPDLPTFTVAGEQAAVHADGFVDCSTCHDVHQWDPRDMTSIAGADDDIDGDGSTSFLRMASAGEGKLCAQCHKGQAMVMGTDHDLRVTAPDEANIKGQTVEQSGVCGQCHGVHNAYSAMRLWVRKPGAAPDAQEALCRSCHARGRMAEDKTPQEARHPGRIKVWSTSKNGAAPADGSPHIPVFNAAGESRDAGVITCSSCHDPHRWSPHSTAKGPGKKTEGNALNSFLRNARTENIVCAECHGADGLFRYKYYHAKSSREKYPLYH